MACLEINCLDCLHIEFTNIPLKACVNCDSLNVSISWDEENDNHNDYNSFSLDVDDWEE